MTTSTFTCFITVQRVVEQLTLSTGNFAYCAAIAVTKGAATGIYFLYAKFELKISKELTCETSFTLIRELDPIYIMKYAIC